MNSLTSRLRKRIPPRQLLKYALVGLISNASGYALYLLLTDQGCPPKLAMTALYTTGALIGFLGNRRLTFSYRGGIVGSGIRFVLVQAGGYAINLCLLVVLVDGVGYAHQWVQAAAILMVAGYLFVALKFFVFKATP